MLVLAAVAALAALLVACSSGDDEPAATQQPLVEGGLPAFDQESADDAAVGETIPEVSGTSLDGEPMTIGPDGDKAEVIVFVAHWCPHCQAEVPRIVEHLRSKPMPDDVELIGVSTGVRQDAPNYPPEAWLEREQWPAPTLADTPDGRAAMLYGLTSYPYFVVADADGKVVVRGSGELSMEEFDRLVAAAQSGDAPS